MKNINTFLKIAGLGLLTLVFLAGCIFEPPASVKSGMGALELII